MQHHGDNLDPLPLSEPLTEPPEEGEGDDAEAGGGRPIAPVHEDQLEDAEPLDEDEEDDE